MERKYGQAQRVWVMDRGMVSEKNIAFLRERNARYLVGTPKAQLRDFEKALLDHQGWHSVQSGLDARLIAHPDGKGDEQYVLCRSTARAEKERAMLARQTEKLCAELQKIDTALREKQSVKTGEIERRIGRWLGKYPAAAKVIQTTLERDPSGAACALTITSHVEKGRWKDKAHGAYLLRTNCTETDPAKLWRWYIQLAPSPRSVGPRGPGLRPAYLAPPSALGSRKPKPHSAPPKATSNCGRSTIKKPSGSKRTSSSGCCGVPPPPSGCSFVAGCLAPLGSSPSPCGERSRCG